MNESPVNRYLLTTNAFWGPEPTKEGITAWRRDESRIPLVLEACLATAVSRVAIPAWSSLADEIQQLPAPLQRMVTLIDDSGRAFRKLSAFIKPIHEEFGVHLSVDFGFPVMIGDPPREDLRGPLLFTLEPLLDFFLGMEYGLQISRKPGRMLEAVDQVLISSRNPETRARLAFVAGVLRSYQTSEPVGLAVETPARLDFVRHFTEMVEDETYQGLSEQAHLWGITEHSRRALQKFQRMASSFVTSSPFAKSLRLARVAVSTTTGLQIPVEEDIVELITPAYVPAMVDMETVWQRARSFLVAKEGH